jgi:succinate dehydrogenase/fumarate reductase-like Fe-S protein
VRYVVSTNEIPIKHMKVGRDVVVDWYFYNDFDTGEKLWLDSNGLEMIRK